MDIVPKEKICASIDWSGTSRDTVPGVEQVIQNLMQDLLLPDLIWLCVEQASLKLYLNDTTLLFLLQPVLRVLT